MKRSVKRLKYINAKKVLPEQLLKELQRYVAGEMVYVPGNDAIRAGWGESNGTRAKYEARNNEILMLYRTGSSMNMIADTYHLSEYSIKKIIHNGKRVCCYNMQNLLE